MNITDIKVRIISKEDKHLKGVASVTFDDCFVVHDIKIIKGNEGDFIAMPSRKTNEGEFKDIVHPIKSETRAMLSEAILKVYQEELAKQQKD